MTALKAMAEIETPHLVLREIERDDADELAAFMTQPRYQRHIAHRLRDGAMVNDFVSRQVAARADSRRHVFHLAAEEKMSGDVVGEGFIINHGNGCFEIGWGVHPAMWAMGLGTEIGRALLGVSFERLKARDVWCKVMDGNTASAKLARRNGMKHMASHQDHPTTPGQRGPVHVFNLSVADYFDMPY
jgi:[ribosomal protein S5]-alanine N-acetyltransferase